MCAAQDNMADKSYFYQPSTRSYLYSTLIQSFDDHCENEPGKEAFIFYDEKLKRTSVTFQKAYDDSLSLATGLLKTNPRLQPGCRICIYTVNKWEYLLSMLAVLRLGGTAALSNIDLHNEEKLLSVIDKLHCCGLIGDSARIESSRLIESLSERNDWIFTVSDDQIETSKGVLSIPELIEIGRNCQETRKEVLLQQKDITPDAGAIIFLSSGTTGDPKAILYSHFKILNVMKPAFVDMGFTHQDKYIHDRPMAHGSGFIGGYCFAVCLGGSSVTVSKKLAETSANTYAFLKLIDREKATGTLLFGFVIYDLVHGSSANDFDLSSLRSVLTVGQMLSEENVGKLMMLFPKLKLIHMYGLAEGVVAMNLKGRDLLRMKIWPGVEVKVVNKNNHLVPLNNPGEICTRSDIMMTGYVTEGQVNTGRDEHGWFHTEDNGIMNASGELFIVGRMSDIIKRGPANVPVIPLEEILDSHPQVKKSAIVPVSDPRLGYDLCACVIPTESVLAETEILDWCSSKFGNDMNGVNLRPKCCIFMDEFPLTVSGKISKQKLKEEVKALLGV